VDKALELCNRYDVRRQNYYDMQLVAVMLLHEIPTIVTENSKDFVFVSEVAALNPFTG
jgi:predicted nucleic acid-binding protein